LLKKIVLNRINKNRLFGKLKLKYQSSTHIIFNTTDNIIILSVVLNIMCVTYSVTSLTMSDPQSNDMRHIR